MRRGVVIAAALLAASVVTVNAQSAERRVTLQQWSTIGGAAVGISLDIYFCFTVYTGVQATENPAIRPAIIGLSSVIQAATWTGAGWLMGELVARTGMRPVVAVLVGPVVGALLSAASSSLTMGTIFGIGIPSGSITISPDADFAQGVDTWGEAWWFGLSRGALVGLVGGALVGLVGTPILSLMQ